MDEPYDAAFVPILRELCQRVPRFPVVKKEFHVGPATCVVVTGRRIPNVLHHIRMRFDSLTQTINSKLHRKISNHTRLYLYGVPVRVRVRPLALH